MSFLTQKFGPLPAWGWGAVAGGGVFLLSRKGGGKPKTADPNDPNGAQGAGAPPSSQAFMYGGSGNNYADQTFGGGSLGMYSWPYDGGGSMFVNLFRHPHHDSWHHGGHDYPFHAFDRHPFFNWGGLFGGGRCNVPGCRERGDHDHDGHHFHGFNDHDADDRRHPRNDPYQFPAGDRHFGPGGDGGRGSRWTDNNASSQGNHVR